MGEHAMDRREAIGRHRETPRPMGVFRVHNRTNGKSLVGSTNDLQSMLDRQRFQLESGGHPNRALQQDWTRMGPDPFDFEVLDVLEPIDEPGYDPAEDLRALETMWREKLAHGDMGY